MKGKLNFNNNLTKNEAKNQFYNTSKQNNEALLNASYDENQFYDDNNFSNPFYNNINYNDTTNDYYNKIEKRLLFNIIDNNDIEYDCNNINTSDNSILVNIII